MAKNIRSAIGTGLSPDQFAAGMTRNQEGFHDWYKRFSWTSQEDAEYFQNFPQKSDVRCEILAADWCGDVVRNVPVVFRLMEQAGIPTEVLIMEENLDVMDQFLTMGGRSIPVVLFVNEAGDVLGQWGPRPTYIQEPMVRFKQENTDRNAADYEENLKAARAEIMKRYGEDVGYHDLIVKEIRETLERI